MGCIFKGTVMRYFFVLAASKAVLPQGIIKLA